MTSHPDSLDLPPARHMRGEIRLPGSKSLSIRALLLAALAAEGPTRLTGLLDSDDTRVMLGALEQLGVRVEREADGACLVHGKAAIPNTRADIFVGNSGLSARTLVAALAITATEGEYRIHGVPRMHERPIHDLVEALNRSGAAIDYLEKPGFPPLRIRPGNIGGARPIQVRGDVSSQFLTGLLQAAPLRSAGAPVVIEVAGELISKPYVEMTLRMMERFGVRVVREGWSRFTVPAGSRYRSPGKLAIEGDASSASYFLAAGMLGGGPVRVIGVGRNALQGDVRFAESLETMGARIEYGDGWIEASRGDGAPAVRAIDADLNHIPDAAMTLAVCALFAAGTSTLRNIASWRVKETDRLAAMAAELRKVGAAVEEGADFLRITPPATLTANAAIDTYDDHRMAMCFSLVAAGGVPVRINEPGCVAKTFPEYFDEFARLCRD